MKELPIGVTNFKDLIKGNFVYVDKTKYIYEMVYKQRSGHILELKVDKTPQEALEQIKAKEHHEPYKAKEVYLIGVNISSESGTIKDWEYEKI